MAGIAERNRPCLVVVEDQFERQGRARVAPVAFPGDALGAHSEGIEKFDRLAAGAWRSNLADLAYFLQQLPAASREQAAEQRDTQNR